jgi:hypothetical protein
MSGGRDAVRRSGLGLLLLAAGRKRGLAYFGTDGDAYLASLAPLLALALVSAALTALGGAPRLAASLGLFTICNLLAPPVVAELLCRRWGRADRWALYANVLNWVQFLFMIVGSVALGVARAVGSSSLAVIAVLGLFGYVIWMQWFVARNALNISRWRTVQLLGAVMLGSYILIMILAIFGGGLAPLQLEAK